MITKSDYFTLECVKMEAGGYEALIVPSVGANMIRLYDKVKGVDIVRTPKADEVENFKVRPQVYGMPLLFPPNRIEDGKYTFNGVEYNFPITIPAQNNYHHGIIKTEPFVVTNTQIGEDYALLELSYFSNMVNDSMYRHLPHQFECRMSYRLSDKGMEHTLSITNLSDRTMPIGVGYHTPFKTPNREGSSKGEYLLRLSIGERWVLDERGLPSGLEELDDFTTKLRDYGIDPTDGVIEYSFTNKAIDVDGNPFTGAVLADTKSGNRVFYEVDDKIHCWVLWNDRGNADWFCPEPQSWAINAPNIDLPDNITGMQSIAPGKIWSTTSKIYVK